MSWDAIKTTLTGLATALSEVTNVDADYTAASHYSQWVNLSPGQSAHIQIEAAFGSTGSDMYFRVIGTLDDSSEAVDSISFVSGSLGFSASATARRSIIVSGLYRFRVEVRKGGTTSGSYTPNVYMRKNGISV